MKQTVFITGATGVLGRDLLEHCHQLGYQILALKRSTSNTEGLPSQIQWIEGDLGDSFSYQDALKQADFVIHAGAMVSFSGKDARKMIHLNTSITKEIVDLCLVNETPLLYVSSVAVLSNHPNQEILTEEDDFDENALNTSYARSKYFAEMEVWRGIAEGLKASIVNPGIILGTPKVWRRSTGMIWNNLQKGLTLYPAGATGYVDGRDVAKILLKLYEKEQFGERFILVADHLSYQEIYKAILRQIGKQTKIRPVPKVLSSLIWRSSELLKKLGFSPTYTKEVHTTLNSHQLYSSEKVKARLQIEFLPIENSIQRMTNAFIESNK